MMKMISWDDATWNHYDSRSAGLSNILKEKRVVSVFVLVFAHILMKDMLLLFVGDFKAFNQNQNYIHKKVM